jgi:hypothetical protein
MNLYVNTCRRPVLAERCLGRIDEVKDPKTSVMIVHDGADRGWLNQKRAGVVTGKQMGCGGARRFAIQLALDSNAHTFMFLDDDMFVMPGFDTGPVTLWRQFRHRHPGCLGSAHRANQYHHLHRELYFDNYVFGTSIPGSCIIMGREEAQRCIEAVGLEFWTDHWDWNLSGFFAGRIVPFRTTIYNVGNDADALHKATYDFDHFLQRSLRADC